MDPDAARRILFDNPGTKREGARALLASLAAVLPPWTEATRDGELYLDASFLDDWEPALIVRRADGAGAWARVYWHDGALGMFAAPYQGARHVGHDVDLTWDPGSGHMVGPDSREDALAYLAKLLRSALPPPR